MIANCPQLAGSRGDRLCAPSHFSSAFISHHEGMHDCGYKRNSFYPSFFFSNSVFAYTGLLAIIEIPQIFRAINGAHRINKQIHIRRPYISNLSVNCTRTRLALSLYLYTCSALVSLPDSYPESLFCVRCSNYIIILN